MSVDHSTRKVPSRRRRSDLRVGSHVRVADAAQILQTLDENGRCHGLPFMPQMAAFCGQKLVVTRWVNNVCVQEPGGMYFGDLSDAVLLGDHRCDGLAQGGCQMACPMMWKTQWLSATTNQASDQHSSGIDKIDQSENSSPSEAYTKLIDLATRAIKATHAKDESADFTNCVSCQATELFQITAPRSKSNIAQYADERNLNRVSATSIATSFCGGMLARIRGQQNGLVGTTKKTPRLDLNLQPGQVVRVRTQKEIAATLDREGKNRGLWFDPVMLRYCGRELTVTKRITRIIDEKSSRLLNLKTPSIVLDDLHCQPEDRRFCSRLLHLFWREIWLERTQS